MWWWWLEYFLNSSTESSDVVFVNLVTEIQGINKLIALEYAAYWINDQATLITPYRLLLKDYKPIHNA